MNRRSYELPVPAPVGAVVTSFGADNSLRHYAVLREGLQPISPVVAAILRNTNSYGLNQPPRLGADDIARLPVASAIDDGAYPSEPVTIVDAADAPLTCAQWTRPADATGGTLQLRTGVTLPVSEELRTVALVGAGSGTTADRVVLTPGSGFLVQTVGQDGGGSSTQPVGGANFWLSDTGVRYGLDTDGDQKTIAALGLTPPPLPIPWSMLSQFAEGPTLSRTDALLAHDGLAADPRPAVVRETHVSRLIFQARRRIAPPTTRKGTITIEPPPELPRMVPPSLLRRVLPYLIVILIIGMIVALVATGMRLMSPTTLFFPFVLLLAATALYRGTDNKMRTEEVDAERADYLRYLSVVRDNVRAHAAEQRAALEWSHPDPALLADVPGTRRQWERDPRRQ